ncbi:MAG: UDP-N-acetylglucosamine 2-epimerase [Phycisphaerales bacterium]|nr:UDP-N-acetylglucosamine 2-epimerase [Phycisphaerales bacterium]
MRMQKPGEERTREADAAAVGRGVLGYTAVFVKRNPDWVVVLGDRIEAFAAASAAAVGGWPLAHIHGGDRAEGVADESMRHAISKLAHLHLAATEQSRERLVRMGEDPGAVVIAGSPGVDGLADVRPLSDRDAVELGDPRVVVLLHPTGLGAREETRMARAVMNAVKDVCGERGAGGVGAGLSGFMDPCGVLVLSPNHDVDRAIVAKELSRPRREWKRAEHLPRAVWLSLLKRMSVRGGVLVGNSSAGLIEAAALGVNVVNVGPRQAGRERGANALDVPLREEGLMEAVAGALAVALQRGRPPTVHPYGDGRAGERIAAELAAREGRMMLRKRNTY